MTITLSLKIYGTLCIIMKIDVRTISGNKYKVEASADSTISTVKELLSPLVHVPVSSIGLIFNQRELSNDDVISQLDLSAKSFLIFYELGAMEVRKRTSLIKEERRVRGPVKDAYGRNIPFNIEDLVTFICAMQFSKEQALGALQYTGYDIDETVSLLLYGKATGTDGKKHSAMEVEKSYDIYSYDDESNDLTNPNMTFVKERAQYNEIAKKMNDLNDDEKNDIEKLHKMFSGFEYSYAYQMYIVNNKNFEAAAEMLSNEKI